jgi:hypothetical protein
MDTFYTIGCRICILCIHFFHFKRIPHALQMSLRLYIVLRFNRAAALCRYMASILHFLQLVN